MQYTIQFEAPDDWNPMIDTACWVDCPFSTLTRLSEMCLAKERFDKHQEVTCPVIQTVRTGMSITKTLPSVKER